MQFTAVYQKVRGGYIAFAEELPGANTQGETLEEARNNLREAIGLLLETNRELSEKEISFSPLNNDLFKENMML
jgi:predicted RNase H-like HicB family nuclease